jgi:hypothetical protein
MSSKLNKHRARSADDEDDQVEETDDVSIDDDSSYGDPRWDSLKDISVDED